MNRLLDIIFPSRRITRLEKRLNRLVAAVPGLKEPPSTFPGDQYTYGTWRGLRARRNERTGYREFENVWTSGPNKGKKFWSTLGLGYEDEFVPDPVKRKIFGLLRA